MASYIASSTSAADGAEFTLSDGASATLNLIGTGDTIPVGAVASICIKTSGGGHVPIGAIYTDAPAMQVLGPGTYIARKGALTTAFGVDKN